MNVTTQQLAELLIGIARAQQAIIDAVEFAKGGFKGTYLAPALDGVAKIRINHPRALAAGISGARADAMPEPRGPQPRAGRQGPRGAAVGTGGRTVKHCAGGGARRCAAPRRRAHR